MNTINQIIQYNSSFHEIVMGRSTHSADSIIRHGQITIISNFLIITTVIRSDKTVIRLILPKYYKQQV